MLHDAIDLLRPAPEHWHTTLLIELATEGLAKCMELSKGVDKTNLTKCDWAARNLLEREARGPVKPEALQSQALRKATGARLCTRRAD
jgi:hypothetical protein